MSLWRYGWWLDGHQASSLVVASSGLALPAGKYYFEVSLTSAGADGTNGWGLLCGICNASTVLTGTVATAINLAQPNSVGGCFFNSNGNNPFTSGAGWGYPDRPNGIPIEAVGTSAVFGIAVDTINKKVWWRNITDNSPSGKYSGGADPNGVPSTNTFGADFSGAGPSPVTGDIYVLIGASHGGTTNRATGTMNFGFSVFSDPIPSGFSSIESVYPGAALNPSDNSNLVLSNGNLSFDGVNVPVSFSPPIFGFSTNVGYHNSCRSVFKIAQA